MHSLAMENHPNGVAHTIFLFVLYLGRPLFDSSWRSSWKGSICLFKVVKEMQSVWDGVSLEDIGRMERGGLRTGHTDLFGETWLVQKHLFFPIFPLICFGYACVCRFYMCTRRRSYSRESHGLVGSFFMKSRRLRKLSEFYVWYIIMDMKWYICPLLEFESWQK